METTSVNARKLERAAKRSRIQEELDRTAPGVFIVTVRPDRIVIRKHRN